jgi:transcriptional regulator with XRE-family HTH domain
MADLQQTVGAVIRRERRGRKLTLKELAERAALSVVYLGEIERGKKCPSIPVLEHLARALDLAVPDLFELVAQELRAAPQPAMTRAVGFRLPRPAETASTDDAVVQMLAPEGVTSGDLTAYFNAIAA